MPRLTTSFARMQLEANVLRMSEAIAVTAPLRAGTIVPWRLAFAACFFLHTALVTLFDIVSLRLAIVADH